MVSVTRRDLSTSKDVTIAVNSVGLPYVCLMNYGMVSIVSFVTWAITLEKHSCQQNTQYMKYYYVHDII